MATGMTYTSLLDEVRRYIERGFTAASDPLVWVELPNLVNAAERRIARELKILGFQKAYAWTMTPGVATYPKPAGWRQTVSMAFAAGQTNDEYTPLFTRTYEYCRTYWPRATVLTGVPKFYADDYNFYYWFIVPTPQLAYNIESLVWSLPAQLGDTTQTNWLTDEAPDMLKYAVLLESAPFLKNDQAQARWQGFYDRALSSTNGEDMQRAIDRAAKRTTS